MTKFVRYHNNVVIRIHLSMGETSNISKIKIIRMTMLVVIVEAEVTTTSGL